jgi:uncharacterized protein YxjI
MADPVPSVEVPAPPVGWSRIVFQSKFGAGRDFDVSDTSGARVLFVDGKIGPTPKAEVRDAQDAVVYQIRGRLLGVPRRMTISTVDGVQVAELKAKMLSPVKNQSTLTMSDGGTWQVQGTLLEKNYSISSEGQPLATISQSWVSVRDKYTVDYLDSLDLGLVMAVVWAIDRWVEGA